MPAEKEVAKEAEHAPRWAGSFTWASVTPKFIHEGDKSLSSRRGQGTRHFAQGRLLHRFARGHHVRDGDFRLPGHPRVLDRLHGRRTAEDGRGSPGATPSTAICNAAAGSDASSCSCRCSASRCSTSSWPTISSRCSSSWELVGICSYLLIGFYYERTSAANAANKAFITNRVGDAGFIIGLLIVWTYVGTLNFQEIFERIRCPAEMNHQSTKDLRLANRSGRP